MLREGLRFWLAVIVYPGVVFTAGLGYLVDRFGGLARRRRRRAEAVARRTRGPVEVRTELALAVACFGLAGALLPLPFSPAPARYANLGGVLALTLAGLWLRGLGGAGMGAAALAWAMALAGVAIGAGTLELTVLHSAGRTAQVVLHAAAGAVVLGCSALLLAGGPVLRARRRGLDLGGLVDQLHAAANWAAWGALALIFTTVFVPAVRPRALGLALAGVAFGSVGILAVAAERLRPRVRAHLARVVLVPLSLAVVLLAPGGLLIR